MPDDNKVPDPATRLMQNIHAALRADMVNHYTCLSPRRTTDGVQAMRVKDARTAKTLRVVVIEEEE